MNIEKSDFGKMKSHAPVQLYTLINDNGMTAKITNYGGIITELWTPDRDGAMADVVLGFDNITDYEDKSPYFGCIVGRYGNRIARGSFVLDGVTYDKLAINNGDHHLHGGLKGFDKQLWDAEPFELADRVGVKLHYLSKDTEGGYPGNLDVTVTYTLTHADELRIDYLATTDKPTICNLTNHSYFNLAGHDAGVAAQYAHEMMINADSFIPIADAGAIPTGEIRPVKGTPMDFTQPKAIGKHIDDDDKQIEYGGGFDHNWVLNKTSNTLSLAATVCDPKTGRIMETHTTEPGMQFYSGNFLDGSFAGKEGEVYEHRYAFCLETQHYPDSPNQPDFPSTILRPGETYKTTTVYKFSVK